MNRTLTNYLCHALWDASVDDELSPSARRTADILANTLDTIASVLSFRLPVWVEALRLPVWVGGRVDERQSARENRVNEV